MAVTKIWQIKHTVKNALDYIMDETKTQGKLLVSGFGVQPETADLEFNMTANLADALHGDRSKIGGSNVLAHHMMQSFSIKDNLTPEQAHELGKQWADEILQGNYEYVISTHVDKGHIHNHVIFNSVSCVDYNKFRSQPFKTAQKLRDVSDKLCQEKGLYVIENPTGRGVKQGELYTKKKGNSWKAKIESSIDKIIPSVANYAEFIEAVQGAGIYVKQDGKYLRYQVEGQKGYVRANGRGLSFDYSKEGIMARINEANRNDIHNITLNYKLVQDGKSKYFTRIPYTKEYVHFDKDSSFWHKNNRTLGTFIVANKEYNICNQQGSVLRSVKGSELIRSYEDKNKKQVEVERIVEQVAPKIQVNGLVKQSAGLPLPLDRRAAFAARKSNIAEIKEMAAALSFMRRESITRYSDFDKKIQALQLQAKRIRTMKLDPLIEKGNTLNDVGGLLVTYNKYKPLMDEIAQGSKLKTKKLTAKYSMEIAAFNHAKNAIIEKGLDPESNYDNLLKGIKQIQQGKQYVQEEINTVQKQIHEVEKMKSTIKKVFDRGEVKQSIRHKKAQDIAL